jgi:hypothetical protein
MWGHPWLIVGSTSLPISDRSWITVSLTRSDQTPLLSSKPISQWRP